jgi:hypothetical protein
MMPTSMQLLAQTGRGHECELKAEETEESKPENIKNAQSTEVC